MLGIALVLASVMGPIAPAALAAGDVGYQDGSYSGSAPTGREPQSKLWFNDGSWWASMYSSGSKAVDIHRLDWATQTWVDTGVRIDERSTSSADALWDGTKLYVASAVSDQSLSCTPSTTGDITLRMLRYSYDAATKRYSLDPGFPVTVANARVQSVSLAKDSTGMVWLTWGYPSDNHGNVYVAHSTTDTASYSTPSVLPLAGVTTMVCGDYSAIVSYNGRIGVMWSNQTESNLYFGSHVDGQPDTSWTRSSALSGAGWADNHVNVKSLVADASGHVFAAAKTSLNGDKCPPSAANTGQPLIVLAWMDGTGSWQRRTVSTAQYCWSRPLVQLDTEHRQVYVFATKPAPNSTYGSGGSIVYKQASLDNPNFDSGAGLPFIELASNPKINNVSGTKQTVGSASGLVVLAADDSTHRYVHGAVDLSGADTTPPTVTTNGPTDGASNVTTSTLVTATFSEPVTASTVSASTFTLTDATAGTGVPAAVSYNAASRTATLTPNVFLSPSHAFVARVVGGASGVTDLAGNPMTGDATWTFSTAAPLGPVFTDGFESGNLSAWSVTTGKDGTATAQPTVVKSGGFAARLFETTNAGSVAYARKSLSGDQAELAAGADVQIGAQASSGTVPLLRLFNAGGTRTFTIDRSGGSGALSFTDGTGTVSLGRTLPLSNWVRLDVHLVAGSGTGVVEVSLDGQSVYSSRGRTVLASRTLQIGNDTKRVQGTTYVDNASISVPGAGPAAPDTTISGGPTGRVNTASASFSFSSSIPGSTFACSLDGAASSPCTSPASYTNLDEGDHTFAVAATANGVTDATPASRAWTVDTTAPTAGSLVPADGATDVLLTTTVRATFSEAMASGSISGSTFTLFDVTASASVPATVAYNAPTMTATLTPTSQLAASHAFTATIKGGAGGASDTAGNPLASDRTWGFTTQAAPADTTNPTVTLTAPGTGATVSGTSVTLSATADDNVAVDHVDFLVGSTVVRTDTTSPYSFNWDSTSVADGPVTITAHAVDTSGNTADDSHGVTVANATGGGPVFTDGFESGTFFAWGTPTKGVDGDATVQSSVVKSGTWAAMLTESSTSGSKAYVRANLGSNLNELTVTEDVQVFAQGTSSQNVPLFRLFDGAGTRFLSLFLQAQSNGKVYAGYGGSNRLTTANLPLSTWANVSVHLVSGTGNGTVEVRFNGTLVFRDTAATVPAIRTLQIGNDTSGQPMGVYVDNVVVTTP